MKTVGPTNPFHLARAYAVNPPRERTAAPVDRITPTSPREEARHKTPSNIDRLVAAVVPGRIDFSSAEPRHDNRSESIPLYRRPEDLNAAATNIHAGRVIDLEA